MKKADLRKVLLDRRNGLTAEFVEEASIKAQNHLLADKAWQQADQVVIYSPVHNEVRTNLLFKDTWEKGKKLFLPRCSSTKGEMTLAACSGTHELEQGKYGILEPTSGCVSIDYDDPAFTPSIVITPGVGFDFNGNRLGFGGGYYDRMLLKSAFNHATFVGLAYSFQVVPALEADPWDQAMDAICTEETLRWL